MAKYKFHQAVCLGDQKEHGAGQKFSVGIHEVPEKLVKHHSFKHFEKCGLITDAGDETEYKAETLAERSARLAKKLAPSASAEEADKLDEDDAEDEGEEDFTDDEGSDDAGDEGDDFMDGESEEEPEEEKAAPKKKKKKKKKK